VALVPARRLAAEPDLQVLLAHPNKERYDHFFFEGSKRQ
jgi:hypothetical protein